MQILKDDVRNRILDAAVQDILAVGYLNSSLRRIAKQADITVGNIYAYFKSKEALLDAILAPTLAELNNVIENLSKGSNLQTISWEALANDITDVFLLNRERFLILMTKCQGSVYASAKKTLLVKIKGRIEQELLPSLPPLFQDEILAATIATAAIDGLLTILQQEHTTEARVRQLVTAFITILFANMQPTLTRKQENDYE